MAKSLLWCTHRIMARRIHGSDCPCLLSTCETASIVLCPVLGLLLNTRDTLTCYSEFCREPPSWSGTGVCGLWGKAEGTEEETASVGSNSNKNWWDQWDNTTRLLTDGHGGRIKENSRKLKQDKIHQAITRNFFTPRIVKLWDRLCSHHPWGFSRPDWIKPSLTWSDFIADSALSRKLDLETWIPFQPELLYDPMIKDEERWYSCMTFIRWTATSLDQGGKNNSLNSDKILHDPFYHFIR